LPIHKVVDIVGLPIPRSNIYKQKNYKAINVSQSCKAVSSKNQASVLKFKGVYSNTIYHKYYYK